MNLTDARRLLESIEIGDFAVAIRCRVFCKNHEDYCPEGACEFYFTAPQGDQYGWVISLTGDETALATRMTGTLREHVTHALVQIRRTGYEGVAFKAGLQYDPNMIPEDIARVIRDTDQQEDQ